MLGSRSGVQRLLLRWFTRSSRAVQRQRSLLSEPSRARGRAGRQAAARGWRSVRLAVWLSVRTSVRTRAGGCGAERSTHFDACTSALPLADSIPRSRQMNSSQIWESDQPSQSAHQTSPAATQVIPWRSIDSTKR